ncbi:MAG: DUF2179 domain-containing protein [Firmicutes bacterium]|nr:DUF2179 domain-containing protein [Bacillota bacterium]
MVLLTCLKIFAARIVDVSLGTLRTVFFVKGKTIEPFIIAFVEVLVWYAVAREALNTTGNTILVAISYAAGYAVGTFIGSKLSGILVKGVVGVQIVVKEDSEKLINRLRKKGYGISIIELKNDYEGKNKDMLYIQVNNRKLKELTSIVKSYDKNAFIVVNETKLIQNGFIK